MVDQLWGFSLRSRRDSAIVDRLVHRLYTGSKDVLPEPRAFFWLQSSIVLCYRNVIGCQDPETMEIGPHTAFAHDSTTAGGRLFEQVQILIGTSERMKMLHFIGIYKI